MQTNPCQWHKCLINITDQVPFIQPHFTNRVDRKYKYPIIGLVYRLNRTFLWNEQAVSYVVKGLIGV